MLSGFFNAARIAFVASRLPLANHRILFFCAESARVGVAKQPLSFFTINGLSLEEAREHIYTVDSKSLIIVDRTGLQERKKCMQHLNWAGEGCRIGISPSGTYPGNQWQIFTCGHQKGSRTGLLSTFCRMLHRQNLDLTTTGLCPIFIVKLTSYQFY